MTTGAGRWELKVHISNHKQKAGAELGMALHPQWWTFSRTKRTYFLSFPKWVSNWGPNIQMPENMSRGWGWGESHSNPHSFHEQSNVLSWARQWLETKEKRERNGVRQVSGVKLWHTYLWRRCPSLLFSDQWWGCRPGTLWPMEHGKPE